MTRQKELTLGNLATIHGMEELRAFWAALNQEQPHMARDPDIIAAKDERKTAIYRQNRSAA